MRISGSRVEGEGLGGLSVAEELLGRPLDILVVEVVEARGLLDLIDDIVIGIHDLADDGDAVADEDRGVLLYSSS